MSDSKARRQYDADFKRNAAELLMSIKQLFEASRQEYGARRSHLALKAKGLTTTLYRVRTLMKQMDLIAKAHRSFKRTTRQAKQPHHIAPNRLNRRFTAHSPNQAWVSDITYVRTQEGWLYVAAILDLFSRKVVGLAMSQSLKVDLVLRATGQAIKRRQPAAGLILHSDRGCQYTSKAYAALAQAHAIQLSMSSTGNCYDNAVADSFFHTLKIACVHHHTYSTRLQATRAIFEYIEVFYNRQRMHSSIGYLSPEQYELCYYASPNPYPKSQCLLIS